MNGLTAALPTPPHPPFSGSYSPLPNSSLHPSSDPPASVTTTLPVLLKDDLSPVTPLEEDVQMVEIVQDEVVPERNDEESKKAVEAEDIPAEAHPQTELVAEEVEIAPTEDAIMVDDTPLQVSDLSIGIPLLSIPPISPTIATTLESQPEQATEDVTPTYPSPIIENATSTTTLETPSLASPSPLTEDLPFLLSAPSPILAPEPPLTTETNLQEQGSNTDSIPPLSNLPVPATETKEDTTFSPPSPSIQLPNVYNGEEVKIEENGDAVEVPDETPPADNPLPISTPVEQEGEGTGGSFEEPVGLIVTEAYKEEQAEAGEPLP